MLPRIPWGFLGILIMEHLQIGRPAQQCTGRSLVKVGGTYAARAIRQYRTKPPEWWEKGVETGWRASLVDEGTVRLSSKGESDRITQRSAVQIRPTQPRTPLPKCIDVRPFLRAFCSLNAAFRLPTSRLAALN